MDEVLLTGIRSADELVEKGDLDEALATLKILAQDYPQEGVIAYYLGRICLRGKDELLALKYFLVAIDRGYVTAEAFLSAALLQKNFASFSETESLFVKAMEAADTMELDWASQSSLAVFYIENEMYLKADEIAQKLIIEFPNNYQGYHLHIVIEAMMEHYGDVLDYMDHLPKEFKNHPQRLIDAVEIYKKAGKESELYVLLKSDPSFFAVVPQVVLREEILATPYDEHNDTKEKLIRQLAKDYHDKDAVISVMVLEFSKKNFKKSAQIANAILSNEKDNQGIRYYISLYLQMYNLYYMAEKRPSAQLRKWVEKAGNWCMKFVDEMGVPEASDIVTSSIQELFDEINSECAS